MNCTRGPSAFTKPATLAIATLPRPTSAAAESAADGPPPENPPPDQLYPAPVGPSVEPVERGIAGNELFIEETERSTSFANRSVE